MQMLKTKTTTSAWSLLVGGQDLRQAYDLWVMGTSPFTRGTITCARYRMAEFKVFGLLG